MKKTLDAEPTINKEDFIADTMNMIISSIDIDSDVDEFYLARRAHKRATASWTVFCEQEGIVNEDTSDEVLLCYLQGCVNKLNALHSITTMVDDRNDIFAARCYVERVCKLLTKKINGD